jgi:hypothetical protein
MRWSLLSAISALSPEGTLYFHCQEQAINSTDVDVFPDHLRREVPGCLFSLWDGAPIHPDQVAKGLLANGAAQRLHVGRRPAYALGLNPGENLWARRKASELANVYCFDRKSVLTKTGLTTC